MPGQVICLVETRHGGGVQYAGHGDDKGSGDRGSAVAVTNEAGNERGGKGTHTVCCVTITLLDPDSAGLV